MNFRTHPLGELIDFEIIGADLRADLGEEQLADIVQLQRVSVRGWPRGKP